MASVSGHHSSFHTYAYYPAQRRKKRQCKFIIILFFLAPGMREKVVNMAKFIWNPSILYFFSLSVCLLWWSFFSKNFYWSCCSAVLVILLDGLNRFKPEHIYVYASRIYENSKLFFFHFVSLSIHQWEWWFRLSFSIDAHEFMVT